jgi:hypothetical protein
MVGQVWRGLDRAEGGAMSRADRRADLSHYRRASAGSLLTFLVEPDDRDLPACCNCSPGLAGRSRDEGEALHRLRQLDYGPRSRRRIASHHAGHCQADHCQRMRYLL